MHSCILTPLSWCRILLPGSSLLILMLGSISPSELLSFYLVYHVHGEIKEIVCFIQVGFSKPIVWNRYRTTTSYSVASYFFLSWFPLSNIMNIVFLNDCSGFNFNLMLLVWISFIGSCMILSLKAHCHEHNEPDWMFSFHASLCLALLLCTWWCIWLPMPDAYFELLSNTKIFFEVLLLGEKNAQDIMLVQQLFWAQLAPVMPAVPTVKFYHFSRLRCKK